MNASILYKSVESEKAVMAIYDAAMKNWAVPYDTQVVETRYGATFVIASGDVQLPVLVLLHGAGGNSTMWAGDVGEYAKQYRVYAVDLIGEAGKSAPQRPAWDSAAFAEWLEDVFNGLKIERAAMVGISQGAWTALKFGVVHPERVEKLVLMTPGGIIPDRSSFIIRAIGWMMLGKWGIGRMVKSLFGDQVVPDGVIDIVTQMTTHFKPRMGVLPIFSDDELRRLTMPILLLGGTKDIMRDMDQIEARLRGLVPHMTSKRIMGGGHALLHTQADVTTFLMQAHQLEPVM
jgi:pimeloyl-ACP methyl ester carboxylesterase